MNTITYAVTKLKPNGRWFGIVRGYVADRTGCHTQSFFPSRTRTHGKRMKWRVKSKTSQTEHP